MTGQLDDHRFAVFGDAADAKPARVDRRLKLRIQPIAAEELLLDLDPLHDPGDERAGRKADLELARQARAAIGGVWQGAGDGHDEERRALGRLVLGVCCILDPQNVPRILYQSMLKAPSGRDKRPPALAGEANRSQRALHTPIGTAGGDPEAVESLQQPLALLAGKLQSQLPGDFDPDTKRTSSVLKGVAGGRMRPRIRIEVSDDADSDHAGLSLSLTA